MQRRGADILQTLVADDGFGALGLLVQAAEAEQTATLATVVESDHPDFPAGLSRLLPLPEDYRLGH